MAHAKEKSCLVMMSCVAFSLYVLTLRACSVLLNTDQTVKYLIYIRPAASKQVAIRGL